MTSPEPTPDLHALAAEALLAEDLLDLVPLEFRTPFLDAILAAVLPAHRAMVLAEAFIAAARELVPALADEVERLRAELAALNDGPDEHVIDLRDDGWTIKHPLSCRPHLFDCPVNRAAERDLTEAPAQLGRFVCLLDEAGGFTIDTTPGGAR